MSADANLAFPVELRAASDWSPREMRCDGGKGRTLYDCVQSDRPDYFFAEELEGLLTCPYLRCPSVTFTGSDGEFRQWFAEGPEAEVDKVVAAMEGSQRPLYLAELGDFCSLTLLGDGRQTVNESATCSSR